MKTTMSVLPGEPGRLGARGNRGRTGPEGYPGPTGSPGRPGFTGRPGPNGDEGARGFTGQPGVQGDPGRRGVKGPEGPVGPRGIRGNRGPFGKRGPPGYAGDKGPAGQDGQKGGKGKPGSAPAGPPGPDGSPGSQGPPGDRGGKGVRGAQGAQGNPGPRGLAGVAGVDGGPGKDAKQAKANDCDGVKTSTGESVCCGTSSVNWHSYYSDGSFNDIDTRACKFSDPPKYFTSVIGNGYIERLMGGSSIYNPTKDGFRVYLAQEVTHRTPSGYVANAYRMRIRWCGVGKSAGPKVPNLCCGTGPASWGRAWHTGTQNIDAKACEMKGDPVWITAAQGAKSSGTDSFIGYNAGFSQTYRYSRMYIHRAYEGQNYWGHISGNHFNSGHSDQLRPKYCLFGEPFPTGGMRINLNEIEADQYPCNGARLVDDGTVKSNQAKICCGKTDTQWKSKGALEVYKQIDTSACNFDDDASNPVVYMTSVGGTSDHWKVTGTTAYIASSATGFSMSLGAHPKQVTPGKAKDLGWYVNWCGIGKAGPPKKPPPPPVPPPPPNAPPPPPTTTLSLPPKSAALLSGTKSLLNSECAKYRDHRDNYNFVKQLKTYAKCMAQDCVQSLETGKKAANPGCRFRDPAHGFCYIYGTAQKWCSENPTNSYCNDGGKEWAIAPVGSAKSPGGTKWTPNQGISERMKGTNVAGSTYDCQCMKDCTCTANMCWCSDAATKPTPPGNGLYAKQLKTGISKRSKDGKCSCTCGNTKNAQMGP